MKTYLQTLEDLMLSEEDFGEILRLWGVDPEAENSFYSLEEILVQRSHEPISARFVWEHLAPDERHVLFQLLRLDDGRGVRLGLVQQATGLSREHFDKALTHISDYALIPRNQKAVVLAGKKGAYQDRTVSTFLDTMALLYSVGKELFLPEADRSRKSFSELLAFYPPLQLLGLAKDYGIADRLAARRSTLIHEWLASTLKEKEDTFTAMAQQDLDLKKLYSWLRTNGGRVSMQEVRKFMGYDDPALRKMLSTLEKNVLAFDTFSLGERVLFIPEDVLRSEQQGVEVVSTEQSSAQKTQQESEQKQNEAATEPTVVRMGETTLLFDIASMVAVAYQQRIELTQSGSIMKRYQPKLRPLLKGLARKDYYEEDSYVEFLLRLMHRMQLLGVSGNPDQGIKDHLVPGPDLEEWVRKDTVYQTYGFLKLWQEGHYWADLVGERFTTDYHFYPNAIRGRQTILKHLRTYKPGCWYSVEDLLERIWTFDPGAFQSYATLGKKDKQKFSAAHVKWLSRDAELYRGILGSTLNEAGLVSLGYGDAVELKSNTFYNPTWFQLTELGAQVLSIDPEEKQSPHAAPEPQKGLLVQPNFELLLLQPDFPTLYQVMPFVQVQQVGLVSKMVLTQASVLKALENGLRVEQIIALLSQLSQKEVPQNIAYSIRDWSRNYHEASVSQVLLLELSDEEAVKVLLSSSKLKKFGFRTVGPTSVITQSDVDTSELRRALEKEGLVVSLKGNIAQQKQNAATYGRYR